MKIHINSLNNILFDFIKDEALPKYETIWRNQGLSEVMINSKVFMYMAGAKLGLKGDLLTKFPLLAMLTDDKNMLNLEEAKETLLDILEDFKNNNKDVIIPVMEWRLDSDDVNKLYEIAKKYAINEPQNEQGETNGNDN